MEMEQITPQIIGKKLWKIVRIVFYMVRKGMSKRKLSLDQVVLKLGKLAGKALSNLLVQYQHHHAALTCRTNDSVRFFTGPAEYEFSCSNSPAVSAVFHARKNNRRRGKIDDVDVLQKVFEILNDRAAAAEGLSPLPGFGRTPIVRQLRVTDSPFPLKDSDDVNSNPTVDIEAEEFIKRFYKDLRKQTRIAALESPSPLHVRAY